MSNRRNAFRLTTRIRLFVRVLSPDAYRLAENKFGNQAETRRLPGPLAPVKPIRPDAATLRMIATRQPSISSWLLALEARLDALEPALKALSEPADHDAANSASILAGGDQGCVEVSLSATGIRFPYPLALEADQKLELELGLDDGEASDVSGRAPFLRVLANVVRSVGADDVTHGSESEHFLLSAHFLRVHPADQDAIAGYVLRRQAEELSKWKTG